MSVCKYKYVVFVSQYDGDTLCEDFMPQSASTIEEVKEVINSFIDSDGVEPESIHVAKVLPTTVSRDTKIQFEDPAVAVTPILPTKGKKGAKKGSSGLFKNS